MKWSIALGKMIILPLNFIITLIKFIASKFHFPLGEINGKTVVRAPQIHDDQIGHSNGFPFAMKFRISEDSTGFPVGIGRKIHRKLFAERPPFTVNVCFSCAKSSILGQSDYSNPSSIWYNVFFGYYQINVLKSEWNRPYAYQIDAHGRKSVCGDDLITILKADWNHLSNELFGVDRKQASNMDVNNSDTSFHSLGRVSKSHWKGSWDHAKIRNLHVVSPCCFDRSNDNRSNAFVHWLWQRAFGTYNLKDKFGNASVSSENKLQLEAYLCYRSSVDEHGREIYQTFVYGGAINSSYDEVDPALNKKFLQLQMDALEKIFASEEGLGFKK